MTTKSDAECEAAIKEFSKITNTDEAFAHSILQDCNFDVEEGVFKFYTEISPDTPLPDQIVQEVLDAPPVRKRKSSPQPDGLPREVSMMSWNIDGINKDAVKTRFTAALNVIAKFNPEIIFFQEFVDELQEKMENVLGKMYYIFKGSEEFPYYTVTLVSRNITITNNMIVPFESTGMGRNMLVVEAKWQDLDLRLVNTHLESMKDYSATRKSQYKQCMNLIELMKGPDTLVLFGGDLNIRDTEIERIAPGFCDVWEEAGAKDSEKFTWDMAKNDNLEFNQGARYKMRFRFDRIYMSGPYKKVYFHLAGKERIKAQRLFPSDHFALCCKLAL